DRNHPRADRQGVVPVAEPDRERPRACRQRRPRQAAGGEGQVPAQRNDVVDDGPGNRYRYEPCHGSGEALMAATRAEKEAELQDLEGAFKGTDSAIILDFKGLKVPEVTELRRQVRGAKANYKVVKNTLATRATKGTPLEPLTS